MKVLIDGICYSMSPFGGIIRYNNTLALSLARIGVHVDILMEKQPKKNVDFGGYSVGVISDPEQVKQYDIFHACCYSSLKHRGGMRILTVHDIIKDLFPPAMYEYSVANHDVTDEESLQAADHIISVSETTRNDFIERYGIPPDKITTVHHGINDVFLSSQSIQESEMKAVLNKYRIDRPFLMVVGGRHGYKNFTSLLKAFDAAPLKESTYIVVAGSQTEFLSDEMNVLEKSLDIPERIRLIGYVNDNELSALYRATNLFVSPSLYEGFGLPVMEAMACGAVVACSSIPAYKEIAGDIPIYFNPDNVEEIVEALNEGFYADNKRRINEGIKHASAFTEIKMAMKVVEVYSKIVDSA